MVGVNPASEAAILSEVFKKFGRRLRDVREAKGLSQEKLAELAGLPAKEGIEGHSLVQQLRDAKAERKWPAITTHNQNNHTVRTERWRYIRYADGSEELYDRVADPNEWTNLAKDPKYADTIRELAAWLPKVNAKAVPGSAHRLLEVIDGKVYWEGKEIKPDEPFR